MEMQKVGDRGGHARTTASRVRLVPRPRAATPCLDCSVTTTTRSLSLLVVGCPRWLAVALFRRDSLPPPHTHPRARRPAPTLRDRHGSMYDMFPREDLHAGEVLSPCLPTPFDTARPPVPRPRQKNTFRRRKYCIASTTNQVLRICSPEVGTSKKQTQVFLAEGHLFSKNVGPCQAYQALVYYICRSRPLPTTKQHE